MASTQIPGTTADFDALSVKEMRAWAKENNVKVPATLKKKLEIAAYLKEKGPEKQEASTSTADENDDLSSLTVEKLRSLAKERSIKIPGSLRKKEEIVVYLEQCIGKAGQPPQAVKCLNSMKLTELHDLAKKKNLKIPSNCRKKEEIVQFLMEKGVNEEEVALSMKDDSHMEVKDEVAWSDICHQEVYRSYGPGWVVIDTEDEMDELLQRCPRKVRIQCNYELFATDILGFINIIKAADFQLLQVAWDDGCFGFDGQTVQLRLGSMQDIDALDEALESLPVKSLIVDHTVKLPNVGKKVKELVIRNSGDLQVTRQYLMEGKENVESIRIHYPASTKQIHSFFKHLGEITFPNVQHWDFPLSEDSLPNAIAVFPSLKRCALRSAIPRHQRELKREMRHKSTSELLRYELEEDVKDLEEQEKERRNTIAADHPDIKFTFYDE